MELKNYEIINANLALGEIVDIKLKGTFKFKLFKIKETLENAIVPVYKALDGVDDIDKKEILNEAQNLDVSKISIIELDDIELSMKQIGMLKPLLILEDLEDTEATVDVERD